MEGDQERPVLRNLNAEFEQGKIHAIVGRSGSGKSTLLNLIAGIDLPDTGTIQVAGREITTLDERQRTLLRREQIGIVFQFFNLISSLTVEENLALPLELNKKPNRSSQIAEALQRVGLMHRASSYPESLSGGEQQRVAVARAFVHRPNLLLADEPTGNLDEENSSQVLQALEDLRGECTVIVVTHNMELAGNSDCLWKLQTGGLELQR